MLVFIRGDVPSFGFAFGVFNRDASIPQVDAQWAHHMLFFGGLQNVTILVVATDRFEVLELFLADLIKAFLEQEEF